MLTYPAPDPVAFHIGSWPVHWYGLMYLVGFLGAWALLSLRRKNASFAITAEQLSDLIFYGALGVILGGRVGYMLFYDTDTLIAHPLSLFALWRGGMSFHGGLLGVLLAALIFSRKFHIPFLALMDFIAPVVPVGLGAGRIGNFINGELWGRVTDVPWAMVFPNAGDLPRHPSQLYEFGLEGVVMFTVLWLYSRKPRPVGAVSGLFAILYAIFRIVVECFREPDVQIGYLYGGMTEGQLLSVPLLLFGIGLMLNAYRRKRGE